MPLCAGNHQILHEERRDLTRRRCISVVMIVAAAAMADDLQQLLFDAAKTRETVSLEAVDKILALDRDAAARPFTLSGHHAIARRPLVQASEGERVGMFAPGDPVRLRPGLNIAGGLRAGELALVTTDPASPKVPAKSVGVAISASDPTSAAAGPSPAASNPFAPKPGTALSFSAFSSAPSNPSATAAPASGRITAKGFSFGEGAAALGSSAAAPADSPAPGAFSFGGLDMASVDQPTASVSRPAQVSLERQRDATALHGQFFAESDLVHAFSDDWLPLHAAAALALPVKVLLAILEAHPIAATTCDAHGKSPFRLLPCEASQEAAVLLFEASQTAPRRLWDALDPATAVSSSAELRATLVANREPAATRFTAADWTLSLASIVRLRPGLGDRKGLRAGQLAIVARIDRDCNTTLRRWCDDDELGVFHPRELVHGFHDWLPLHAAAALGLPAITLSVILRAHADAATMPDDDGKLPYQLVASSSTDEAATLLFEASGAAPRPLWEALDPGTAAASSAELRAAIATSPIVAAHPFAPSENWVPAWASLVRLRPGLDNKKGLRAGELAIVTHIDRDGDVKLKRHCDGQALWGVFSREDLVHGFDKWPPLHAAAALAMHVAAVSAVLEAYRPAATMPDASSKLPHELLPFNSTDQVAALLYEARAVPARSVWEALDVSTVAVVPSELQTGLDPQDLDLDTPFSTPAGWVAGKGSVVRLRPELCGDGDSRAHQLLTVAGMDGAGNVTLKQKPGDTELSGPFASADLTHGFEGLLPLHVAAALALPAAVITTLLKAYQPAAARHDSTGSLPLALALCHSDTTDDVVMQLAGAAPSATGADGRTPLHLASAAARSTELLQQLLSLDPASATKLDNEGRNAFQLLPFGASEATMSLLCEACGPRPLWEQLDPTTAAASLEEVCAALKVDPRGAEQAFVAPTTWCPTVGSLVRLQPGLEEKYGFSPGSRRRVGKVVHRPVGLEEKSQETSSPSCRLLVTHYFLSREDGEDVPRGGPARRKWRLNAPGLQIPQWNIRARPDTSSEVLRQVGDGAEVEAVGVKNGWLELVEGFSLASSFPHGQWEPYQEESRPTETPGPPETGLRCWLDASEPGAVTTDFRLGQVTAWQDRSVNNLSVGPDGQGPTTGLLNGRAALNFRPGDSLKAVRGCRVRTVALVVQHRSVSTCMMLFSEFRDEDFSIRVGDGQAGYRRNGGGDGNDWQCGKPEKLFLNGDNESATWRGFPASPVVIIAEKRDGRRDDDDFVFQLSSRFLNRGFDGLLGEVLVYDRGLNRTEVAELHRYLGVKWGIDVKGAAPAAALDGEGLASGCFAFLGASLDGEGAQKGHETSSNASVGVEAAKAKRDTMGSATPFISLDLVHGFEGLLPLHAAVALMLPEEIIYTLLKAHPHAAAQPDPSGLLPLALALSRSDAADGVVLQLAVAAPSATGADGRTPLHLASAAARSTELLQRMLDTCPAWATKLDNEGKNAFQLLPFGAKSSCVSLLCKACGPRPLWETLDPSTATASPEEVCAALDVDPSGAAQTFVTPTAWSPKVGSLVRLRPGLSGRKGLGPGELATIVEVGRVITAAPTASEKKEPEKVATITTKSRHGWARNVAFEIRNLMSKTSVTIRALSGTSEESGESAKVTIRAKSGVVTPDDGLSESGWDVVGEGSFTPRHASRVTISPVTIMPGQTKGFCVSSKSRFHNTPHDELAAVDTRVQMLGRGWNDTAWPGSPFKGQITLSGSIEYSYADDEDAGELGTGKESLHIVDCGNMPKCVGRFTRRGDYNDRPLYMNEQGAIIYFWHKWKLNNRDEKGGWYYAVRTYPGSEGLKVPPQTGSLWESTAGATGYPVFASAPLWSGTLKTPPVFGGTAKTFDKLTKGMRVRRGPDWKWDDQDGGAGNLGTVLGEGDDDEWVRVEWDAPGAHENSYRWGSGKHDLEVVSLSRMSSVGDEFQPTAVADEFQPTARLKQIGRHGTVEISANGLSIQTRDGFPTVGLTAVGDTPLRLSSGKVYYEVTIGDVVPKYPQYGWCDERFDGSKRVEGVGDDHFSWGIDGHRVRRWHKSASMWGEKWNPGDVLGCMANLDNKSLSYSINGKSMGVAFTSIDFRGCLYPALTSSRGQMVPIERAVTCNFGEDPARPLRYLPEGYSPVVPARLIGGSSTSGEPAGFVPGEGNDLKLKRRRDSKELSGYFRPAEFVHGFDAWLPLHAAAALALPVSVLEAMLDANLAAAAAPDAAGLLPLSLVFGSSEQPDEAVIRVVADALGRIVRDQLERYMDARALLDDEAVAFRALLAFLLGVDSKGKSRSGGDARAKGVAIPTPPERELGVDDIAASSNQSDVRSLVDGSDHTFWQSNGESGSHWIEVRNLNRIGWESVQVLQKPFDSYTARRVDIQISTADDPTLRTMRNEDWPEHVNRWYTVISESECPRNTSVLRLRIRENHSSGINTKLAGIRVTPPTRKAPVLSQGFSSDDDSISEDDGDESVTVEESDTTSSHWSCPACTLHNARELEACEACGRQRERGTKQETLPRSGGDTSEQKSEDAEHAAASERMQDTICSSLLPAFAEVPTKFLRTEIFRILREAELADAKVGSRALGVNNSIRVAHGLADACAQVDRLASLYELPALCKEAVLDAPAAAYRQLPSGAAFDLASHLVSSLNAALDIGTPDAAAVLSAVDGHELAEAVSRAVQVSRSVAAAAPATLQRVAPLVSALRCGADIRNMWQDTLARRMLRGRIISIERERRAVQAVDPDGTLLSSTALRMLEDARSAQGALAAFRAHLLALTDRSARAAICSERSRFTGRRPRPSVARAAALVVDGTALSRATTGHVLEAGDRSVQTEILIVTRSAWPSGALPVDPISLPVPFSDVIAEFERFWPKWRGRPARNAKPLWCLTAGSATVRARLSTGQSCDVLCTVTQAFALLLFNEKRSWSLGGLAEKLGVSLELAYAEVRALLAPAQSLLLADANFWRKPFAGDTDEARRIELVVNDAFKPRAGAGGTEVDVIVHAVVDVVDKNRRSDAAARARAFGWRIAIVDAAAARIVKAAGTDGLAAVAAIDAVTREVRRHHEIDTADAERSLARLCDSGLIKRVLRDADTAPRFVMTPPEDDEASPHAALGSLSDTSAIRGRALLPLLAVKFGLSSESRIGFPAFAEGMLQLVLNHPLAPDPSLRAGDYLNAPIGKLLERLAAPTRSLLEAHACALLAQSGHDPLSTILPPSGSNTSTPAKADTAAAARTLRHLARVVAGPRLRALCTTLQAQDPTRPLTEVGFVERLLGALSEPDQGQAASMGGSASSTTPTEMVTNPSLSSSPFSSPANTTLPAFSIGSTSPDPGFRFGRQNAALSFGSASTSSAATTTTSTFSFGTQETEMAQTPSPGSSFGAARPVFSFGAATPAPEFPASLPEPSIFGAATADKTIPETSSTRVPGSGTGVPHYQSTTEKDPPSFSRDVNYQAITSMAVYASESFEELRFQDYQKANRGSGPILSAPSVVDYASLTAPSQIIGTGMPPFRPTHHNLTSSSSFNGAERQECVLMTTITAMTEYGSKSVEELRWEDYHGHSALHEAPAALATPKKPSAAGPGAMSPITMMTPGASSSSGSTGISDILFALARRLVQAQSTKLTPPADLPPCSLIVKRIKQVEQLKGSETRLSQFFGPVAPRTEPQVMVCTSTGVDIFEWPTGVVFPTKKSGNRASNREALVYYDRREITHQHEGEDYAVTLYNVERGGVRGWICDFCESEPGVRVLEVVSADTFLNLLFRLERAEDKRIPLSTLFQSTSPDDAATSPAEDSAKPDPIGWQQLCDAIADTVADAVPVIQDPNAERTVAEAGFGAIVAATHLISLAARELQHVLIPDMSPIAVLRPSFEDDGRAPGARVTSLPETEAMALLLVGPEDVPATKALCDEEWFGARGLGSEGAAPMRTYLSQIFNELDTDRNGVLDADDFDLHSHVPVVEEEPRQAEVVLPPTPPRLRSALSTVGRTRAGLGGAEAPYCAGGIVNTDEEHAEQASVEMVEHISSLASLVGLPSSVVEVLLLLHGFDSARVADAAIERLGVLLRGAGLPPRGNAILSSRLSRPSEGEALGSTSADDVGRCPVCMDDVPVTDLLGPVLCGHHLCRDCWPNALSAALDKLELPLRCPMPKCKTSLPSSVFSALGAQSEFIADYNKLVLSRFIDARNSGAPTGAGQRSGASSVVRTVRCKGPRCNAMIALARATQLNTHCDRCASDFCARCDYPRPHSPATCAMVTTWRDAGGHSEASEAELKDWLLIKSISRPCPKCKHAIVKIPGTCNHMTCDPEASGCGACARLPARPRWPRCSASRCTVAGEHFCYLCLSKWDRDAYRCTSRDCPSAQGDIYASTKSKEDKSDQFGEPCALARSVHDYLIARDHSFFAQICTTNRVRITCSHCANARTVSSAAARPTARVHKARATANPRAQACATATRTRCCHAAQRSTRCARHGACSLKCVVPSCAPRLTF